MGRTLLSTANKLTRLNSNYTSFYIQWKQPLPQYRKFGFSIAGEGDF
jgi:hypothetical protein